MTMREVSISLRYINKRAAQDMEFQAVLHRLPLKKSESEVRKTLTADQERKMDEALKRAMERKHAEMKGSNGQ